MLIKRKLYSVMDEEGNLGYYLYNESNGEEKMFSLIPEVGGYKFQGPKAIRSSVGGERIKDIMPDLREMVKSGKAPNIKSAFSAYKQSAVDAANKHLNNTNNLRRFRKSVAGVTKQVFGGKTAGKLARRVFH